MGSLSCGGAEVSDTKPEERETVDVDLDELERLLEDRADDAEYAADYLAEALEAAAPELLRRARLLAVHEAKLFFDVEEMQRERDAARAEVEEAERLMLHWRDIALTPPLLALQAERDMLADALRGLCNATLSLGGGEPFRGWENGDGDEIGERVDAAVQSARAALARLDDGKKGEGAR